VGCGRGEGRDEELLEVVGREVVVGDGQAVGGAALVRDVVRRVGQQHVRRLPAQHPRHVGGLGGVAAEEAVAADGPQVAGAGHRHRRRLGDVVRVAGRGRGRVGEQRQQVVLGEPRQAEVEVGRLRRRVPCVAP